MTVDRARLVGAFRELMAAIGGDTDRADDVAARAAASYAELFDGVGVDPTQNFAAFVERSSDCLVTLRGIAFGSMCEHNLLPFPGRVHVGYLPGPERLIAGWGEIVRVVNAYAHRPQIQERMTSQIADALAQVLRPAGLVVIVDAAHPCLAIVGERQADARALTVAARGCYVEDSVARTEVTSLLRSA